MSDYDTHSPPVQRDDGIREPGLHDSRTTPVNKAVAYTPVDRVRWGPILAGLFTAVSTLALLSTLIAAIGLSTYDAGDSGKAFAIGTGIWAAVSALIAFFVGGLIAGRTSALPGRGVGLLNGAMVWAVGIPVLLYLVTSLAGSAVNTAGSVAATAANTATNAAAAAAPAVDKTTTSGQVKSAATDAVNQAQQTAANAKDKLQSVNANDVRQGVATAAEKADSSVWYTLLGMVLALAAAAVGGAVGARDEDDDRRRLA